MKIVLNTVIDLCKMNKTTNVSENYICIHCGHSVGELYKEYSPSVLKMSKCDKCHQIADKYIEYDPVIVIIDLVLLNRQAYRHIIYNTTFKNHWKLAIILLLVESYYNWSSLNEDSIKIKNFQDIHYDLFQGEKNFYITFGKTAFEMALSFITLNAVLYFLWTMDPTSKPTSFCLKLLWKCLVLSYFGVFSLILHLIWGIDGSTNPMNFVMSYIFLSQVQALSVVCQSSRWKASIVASVGFAVKMFTRSSISSVT